MPSLNWTIHFSCKFVKFMHYFQSFLGYFKRISTTAKASVKSQPNTKKSYFLSQMNRIECTFPCVPHILYWHCPSTLWRGWQSYFCTLYIVISRNAMFMSIFWDGDLDVQLWYHHIDIYWKITLILSPRNVRGRIDYHDVFYLHHF